MTRIQSPFSNRLLLALIILGITAHSLRAVVPESVVIREQPPEIERIIVALETKAQVAVGTWRTITIQQDAEGRHNALSPIAHRWIIGISANRAWYWASDAQPPATTAGYVLFDNGEDAVVLPYGPNRELGGIRFQYDAIRNGFTVGSGDASLNYTMAFYLFHMNLLPRQFIGALGGLTKIGEEKLGGSPVIHLRADPKADDKARNDPAINAKANAPQTTLDLFYDPKRNTIVKAVYGPTLVLGAAQGPSTVLTVTAWDTFNTHEFWPAKLEGQKIASGGAQNNVPPRVFTVGTAFSTTVEGFTPGNDQRITDLRQQVHALDLILTPPPVLRTAAFYKEALARVDSPHDRAALVLASFRENDALTGLAQWDLLDRQLASPEARVRFRKPAIPLAASAIAHASPDPRQQPACITLLTRIARASPNDDFASAADGAERAWETLLHAPHTRTAAVLLAPDLLPRLSSFHSVFILDPLVRLAKSRPDDAALIDPYLRTVFDQPVPSTGFSDSQQAFAFVAALRANDLLRARAYLDALRWAPGAKQDDLLVARYWHEAFASAAALRNDDDSALPQVITLHHQFASLTYDSTDRVYGTWFLSKAGLDFLRTRLNEPAKPQPDTVMRQTAAISGASEFWQDQIMQLAKQSVFDPTTIERLGPFIGACGHTFGLPGFESALWGQLANNRQIRGKNLNLQLAYASNALATAPDDAARVRTIDHISQIYASAHEFQKGAAAVEAALTILHDEAAKKRAQSLLASLKSQAAETATQPAPPSPPPQGGR